MQITENTQATKRSTKADADADVRVPLFPGLPVKMMKRPITTLSTIISENERTQKNPSYFSPILLRANP